MRLAVGADENTPMAEAVLADLKRRGHEVIAFGPLAGEKMLSPSRCPRDPGLLVQLRIQAQPRRRRALRQIEELESTYRSGRAGNPVESRTL
jgi:hypothetical protein